MSSLIIAYHNIILNVRLLANTNDLIIFIGRAIELVLPNNAAPMQHC